jgi:hypothetical protein
MSIGDITELIVAAVALVGIVGALMRWLFKRGGDERELSVSLRAATSAITDLTSHMRHFADTLNDHDKRITVLESRERY